LFLAFDLSVSDLKEAVLAALSDIVVSSVSERLYIDGIEVTQGIQYYHSNKHLTDPADQLADNSVPLMAKRTTWVRVYVRGFFVETFPFVNGNLEVEQVGFANVGPSSHTLSPKPPGVAYFLPSNWIIDPYQPVPYSWERGDLRYSLNFTLPADWVIGHLMLRANIWSERHSASKVIHIQATRQQTLRLAGIMIGYYGPGSNGTQVSLTAPTLTDLAATSAYSIKIMPVRTDEASYRIAGTLTIYQPLNDPQTPNSCTQNWDNLLSLLRIAVVNDGNRQDVIYCGLLPGEMPVGPVIGCGGGDGLAVALNGSQETMAHEIGHALGLKHAPCGASNTDPNYPAYEPYDPPNIPAGSIGEYGLDIDTGRTWDPMFYKDYMGNCRPKWISPYHYRKLIGNTIGGRLDLQVVGILGPPIPTDETFSSQGKPESLISIIGIVHNNKTIEVLNISRVIAFRHIPNGKRTELIAELLDSADKVISKASLHSITLCPCIEYEHQDKYPDPPYSFQAFLTDVAPGARLRISREGQEIWTRQAPASPPRISEMAAEVNDNGFVDINWTFETSSEQETEAWLQYSIDEGKKWMGLAVGLRGNNTRIDASTLPSGLIFIRILVHDGYYTTTSEPIEVSIPHRPPSVVVMNPLDGSTVQADSTLHLWAIATRSTLDRANPKSVRWMIDDKEIATSLDVYVVSPSEGEHACKLYLEDEGEIVEKAVRFKTISLANWAEKNRS
jgi:hypothetical protein